MVLKLCNITVLTQNIRRQYERESKYGWRIIRAIPPEDAKDSKTYRVVNRDGSPKIKPHGGYNRINGKTYMEAIFFHRTNWSGKATSSSQGCLIIDARFWRQVEQQLGTSSNIYLLLNRQ